MTDKEELTRGDALAKVAALEAENAELRKRVCVPEGWMVVPSQCTSQMEDAYDQQCADDNAYGCSMHLPAYEAMLAAAPAPVDRNQCDGCQAGIPVESGMHRMGKPGGYADLMACTAERYGSTPVEQVEQELVGEIILFASDRDLKEVAWAKGKMPPVGTKIYATPQPSPSSAATAVVGWINEDELPENYPYDAMFPFSKVDIVRMFPVYAPAPDVAGLVEALRSIYDEDYQAPHDATDFDVSESRKQCIYRIRRKVKDALAAHQQPAPTAALVTTEECPHMDELHSLDKQCRDDVARSMGMTPVGDGYPWSGLLAGIKSMATRSAAQDVAGLVEALEWCEKWFSRHSPTAALISGEHATHPMLSSIRAALAAHQSGGAKL